MRLRPRSLHRHLTPRAALRGAAALGVLGLAAFSTPSRRAEPVGAYASPRDTIPLSSGVTLAIFPGSTIGVTVYPSGPVNGAPAAQFQLSRLVAPSRAGCIYIVGMRIMETNGAVVAHKDLPGSCNVQQGSAVLAVQPVSSTDLLTACSGKFTQPATAVTRTHAYIAELLGTSQGAPPSPVASRTVTITSNITCAPGPFVHAVTSIAAHHGTVPRPGGICPAQLAFDDTITANMSGMANSTLTARWERSDGTTYPAALRTVVGQLRLWSAHLVQPFPNGATGSMRLHVLTPNDVRSAADAYQAQCTAPTTATVAAPKGGIPQRAKLPVKKPLPPHIP